MRRVLWWLASEPIDVTLSWRIVLVVYLLLGALVIGVGLVLAIGLRRL